MTDRAIEAAFAPLPVEIIWNPAEELPGHPNGMRFEALDATGSPIAAWQATALAAAPSWRRGKLRRRTTFTPTTV
jgi:L-serine dehydratase